MFVFDESVLIRMQISYILKQISYMPLSFLAIFRCHLPLLYIGLEYGLSNNIKLAERFFTQAQTIAPEDPFVLHELGVVAYQNQE